MKLLVCGGRDYDDQVLVFAALDAVHAKCGVKLLIHGAARGADSLAGKWAAARNIPVLAEPANWARYGNRAGRVRNEAMLRERPNGVVAFPGGRGTAHMIAISIAAGVLVWQPRKKS